MTKEYSAETSYSCGGLVAFGHLHCTALHCTALHCTGPGQDTVYCKTRITAKRGRPSDLVMKSFGESAGRTDGAAAAGQLVGLIVHGDLVMNSLVNLGM